MKNKKSRITPENLEQVKMMTGLKMSPNQISKIIGISSNSVRYLVRCDTWQDYLDFRETQRIRVANSQGRAGKTATGIVFKTSEKPLNRFQIKLLNILTMIEQDLDDINKNLIINKAEKYV